MSDHPYLSLVIPVYNERENVPTLLDRAGRALAQTGRPFEVIICDDGSTDETPQLLAEGQRRYPWLRVLRMARHGRQSAAFDAGVEAARGGRRRVPGRRRRGRANRWGRYGRSRLSGGVFFPRSRLNCLVSVIPRRYTKTAIERHRTVGLPSCHEEGPRGLEIVCYPANK